MECDSSLQVSRYFKQESAAWKQTPNHPIWNWGQASAEEPAGQAGPRVKVKAPIAFFGSL